MPDETVQVGPEVYTAAALEAAKKALDPFEFGVEPVVVVTIGWCEPGVDPMGGKRGGPRAVGSRIDGHDVSILGDSLRQSAEEADEAYRGSGC